MSPIVLALVLIGLPGHPATESFDQENLKRNDHGCPSAIYIAPHGYLELCPPGPVDEDDYDIAPVEVLKPYTEENCVVDDLCTYET